MLKSFIEKQYDLVVDDTSLEVDGVNTTYRITSGGDKYYFKCYSFDKLEEVLAKELALLHGFPRIPCVDVVRPIPTRYGAYLIERQEPTKHRLGCLFTGAKGEPLQWNCDSLRRFGEALAHLHNALEDKPDSQRSFSASSMIDTALEYMRSANGVTRNLVDDVHSLLDLLPLSDQLSYSWCHGDARLENARDSGDKITFFDFESNFYGPRLFDLATILFWMESLKLVDRDPLWSVFLDSYVSVTQVNEKEIRALGLMVCLNQVRALSFLSRYCQLEPASWRFVEQAARSIFKRYAAQ